MKNTKCHAAISWIILLLICVWAMTSPIGCSWNNGNINTESIFPNGKVTLSWDEVHDATSYNVYFSTQPGSILVNRHKIQNAANPITIVDLEPGTTYYFTVTVVDDFGEGQMSKEISYRVKDPEGFIKIENLLAPQDQIIFFDTNSTKLLKSEIEKLNRFAQYILGISSYRIRLEGYTDSSGDIKNNRLISKNRAEVVKSYLIGRGVKVEDIDIVGYAATNFISDNSTDEGRRMNRRVEINFYISK